MVLCSLRQHWTVSCKDVATWENIARHRCGWSTKKRPTDKIRWRDVNPKSRRVTRDLDLEPTTGADRWRRGRSPTRSPTTRTPAAGWPFRSAEALGSDPPNPFSPLLHTRKAIREETV